MSVTKRNDTHLGLGLSIVLTKVELYKIVCHTPLLCVSLLRDECVPLEVSINSCESIYPNNHSM